MTLLLAQLQNQNPLEPVSDKELIGQLTQFSTLQGITDLNANFGDLLQLQQLTQGNSMLGRKVTYQVPGLNTLASGVVSALLVDNGSISLQIGNNKVALSNVRAIEESAA